MNTAPITRETLAGSVIAVPPLARNADFSLNQAENAKLVQHLEQGGVSTLLYGGNAILYHVPVSEYASLLALLTEVAAEQTLVIPSVGPAFGTMMDQAQVLREFQFPTAMILPQRDICTADGIATAVRMFVEKSQRPAVLYIKHDRYIDAGIVKQLADDGLLSWIKYAVVRENPASDDYLQSLVDAVGPDLIVSGIGEQPAIDHLRGFGLTSFTSGCVCVAPRRSMEMLQAIQANDFETAESIRSTFRPLEDLRNSINPVRVLHTAVSLSGIGEMGPILPLLSEVDVSDRDAIETAACQLLELERTTSSV